MQKDIRSKIVSALYEIAKHYIFMITAMAVSLSGVMIGLHICFGAEIEKASLEIIVSLFSDSFFFISSMVVMIALSIREYSLNNNKEIILVCFTEVLVVFNIFYENPWKSAIVCMLICEVFRRIYEFMSKKKRDRF